MGFLKSQKECYFLLSHRKLSKKLNKVCIHSKRNWQPGSYQFLSYMLLDNYLFVSLALPFCALFTRYIPAEPFTLNVAVFCPAGTLNDFTLAPLAENTIISDPFSLLSLKFTCMSAPLLAMVEERFIPPGTVLTFWMEEVVRSIL